MLEHQIPARYKGENGLPTFVREQYPQFVAFLQAYHDFLDLSQANIQTIQDIDTTLDEFLVHFRRETNADGIIFPQVDERFLIKHIKDLYMCKGTAESYSLLFKLLFNKDVLIKYPWSKTLKTSDGKWEQKMSVFVKPTSGDPYSTAQTIGKIISHNRLT